MPFIRRYKVAPLNKRILAYVLDMFLAMLVTSFIIYLFIGLDLKIIINNYMNGEINNDQLTQQVLKLYDTNAMETATFLIYAFNIIYFVIIAYFLKGASLGKKMVGICIIDDTGNPPSIFRLFLREFIYKILAFNLTFYTLAIFSFIRVITNRKRQSFHDLLARTNVVESDSYEQIDFEQINK